jgi:uncharacterized protein (DUF433 family)
MTTTNPIEVNPEVMLGKPVIRVPRITVALLLRKITEAATEVDFLDTYPNLAHADIQAAIAYAADTLAHSGIGCASSLWYNSETVRV